MSQRESGTVKFYNEAKGFGFIRQADGKEYFFHVTSLQDGVLPASGDFAEFSIGEGRKGPAALAVVIAKD
ncbi:MAG: cold-shock protein [Terriglobales bacterium]